MSHWSTQRDAQPLAISNAFENPFIHAVGSTFHCPNKATLWKSYGTTVDTSINASSLKSTFIASNKSKWATHTPTQLPAIQNTIFAAFETTNSPSIYAADTSAYFAADEPTLGFSKHPTDFPTNWRSLHRV